MNKDLALKYLVHKDEKLYFCFALVISFIIYVSLLVSIIGIIPLLIFTMFSFFIHGLMIAHIRTNGVRLSAQQFPEVFEKVRELCGYMGMHAVPDVYVIESGGTLNAFATRFFRRNMVVLYSDVFDLINSTETEELSFIIAHELAHIKRNHIMKQLLILPAMWIPFLSEAYSRACEYTCDRMAANYVNNPEAAMNGLTMLAIGKSLFKKVNRSEYLLQSSQENGFFVWLAEKISSHPPLPKRIYEIQEFVGDSSNSAFRRTPKVTWAIAGLVLIIFTLAGIGFLYGDELKQSANSLLPDASSEEEIAMIIGAVADGDITKVKAQLESGINPDIQDSDGWTPLMWAAQDNNIAMINLLIEAGADPNMADSYGWTPLMAASSSGNIESVRVLLEASANPNSKDGENFTAFLHAKKSGYKDIADLIKQYEKNTK